MYGKLFILCASFSIFQTITCQFIGNNYANAIAAEAAYANGMAYGPLGNNYANAIAAEAAYTNGMAYGPLGNNYANAIAAEAAYANNLACGPLAGEIIPEVGRSFNGGGLRVTSFSPISPTGVTVESDNLMMEGPLAVSGRLPFSGVVAVEGPLPAVGHGAVAYACGDGNVGIVSETIENGFAPGLANGLGLAAGLTGLGYNGIPNGLGYKPML